MSKLQNYQANAIKTIYGHDTYIERDNVTNDEVLDFYQKNMNYNDSISIPDQLKPISNYHKLTNYAWAKEENEERNDGLDEQTKSKISINRDIYLQNKHSYKLLEGKEINWEYAHLPGLDFQDMDLNIPLEYNKFSIDTSGTTLKLTFEHLNKTFEFNNLLPNNVYNTYDLLKIIDYLLLRIKVLYFLLNVIKEQRSTIQDYQKMVSQENNE